MDNTELNPGTGGNIAATDDIAGVHWQRIKLTMGADGVNDGDVADDNPMPIKAAMLPLPTGAASDATLAAVQALLSSIAATIAEHGSAFVDGSPGQIMLAKRRDSDSTSVADGGLNTLNMDEEGRLKVASKPASYAATVGNVTSAASTVVVNTERFSNLMIHCAGTFAGANCTFEGSLNSTNGTDGNWFAVQAIRSNANTIETTTGVLAAAPAYAWELSVNALKYFRVRATAWTSGTQVWTMIPGTYATEPIPGAQISGTQPVSGTMTANIGTSGLVVYTDSSTNLAGAATFTGTSRDGGATPAYNKFVVNAVADQAGTVRVEKSTDNTTWRRATADIAVAASVPQQLEVLVTTRYMRAVYVNGGVAQTLFSLTSAYHRI